MNIFLHKYNAVKCRGSTGLIQVVGLAISENYSLHGATRPKVNTCSLDGSRKSGGAMPSNSKSGGANCLCRP